SAWWRATPWSARTMSQSSPLPTRIISWSASVRLAPACRPERMRRTLAGAGACAATSVSGWLDDMAWLLAEFCAVVVSAGLCIDLAGLHDAQVRGEFLVGQHRQVEEINFHQLAQVAAHVERAQQRRTHALGLPGQLRAHFVAQPCSQFRRDRQLAG